MPDVEHCIKTIQLGPELTEEVKKLEAEGWTAMPGVLPVVVYHLVRTKPKEPKAPDASPSEVPAAQGALGIIRVDDTKVSILRGGELISQ